MLHERQVCQIRGSLRGLLGAMVRFSGYCSPPNSGTLAVSYSRGALSAFVDPRSVAESWRRTPHRDETRRPPRPATH
jgi:hypothetical protein